MTDNEGLTKEFFIESYENLDRLDRDLVELEEDPRNQELRGSIFRTLHTINGTVGFLGRTTHDRSRTGAVARRPGYTKLEASHSKGQAA